MSVLCIVLFPVIICNYMVLSAKVVNVSCSLSNKIVNKTSESFISFNLDYANGVYKPINYTNSQFIYLTKQLSPSYLRVAGTSSDYAYYQVGNENPCHLPPPINNEHYTCFSMDNFIKLVNFTKSIDAKLIWSISAGYPTYPTIHTPYWNSSNARQFLQYLHDILKYDENDIYGFGLGNEINLGDPFLNATWQINAFKELNNILIDIWGDNHSFILLGPDPHSGTVRNSTNYTEFHYIEEFYDNTCDILTFGDYHVYIDLNDPYDYLTPSGLDTQYYESSRIMNEIDFNKNECMKDLKYNIIAGEIGPMNNNDVNDEMANMVNKYWDGFWWLDAMGILSKIGQKAGLRWCLFEFGKTINIDLLGPQFWPNPDYFTSLLYQNLMSINVLNIESNNEYLRIYSQCTSTDINTKIYNDNNLKLVNPVSLNYIALFNNTEYDFVNIYIDNMDDLILGDVILWDLSPGNKTDGLKSDTMMLNDELLILTNNGKLPSLKGQTVIINKQNNFIQVPTLRYGFIVFTETRIDVCSTTAT